MSKEATGVSKTGFWVNVLLAGALCGLLETFGSSLIKSMGLPFRAGILTGFGFMILAFFMALTGSRILPLLAALIAILFKVMAVPFVHACLTCKVNTSMAVFLEYGALSLGMYWFSGLKAGSISKKAAIAGGSALTASLLFYYFGLSAHPCNYLMSFMGGMGFLSYLAYESLSLALLGGLLFPVGFLAGERVRSSSFVSGMKPAFYYTLSLSLVVFSLLASVLSELKGLS